MNTHVNKTQKNKSQAIANASSKKERGGPSAFQFVDHRPETITQRKQQEIMNNSPQVKQLKAFQVMMNNHSGISQFMPAAMAKHTFKGDRNNRLSGFHSKADQDGAELKGTGGETSMGIHGAYTQSVVDAKFNGPPDQKTKKAPATSTFFPDAMSKEEVISAVDNAEGDTVKAEGKAWDGMKIHKGAGAFPKD